MSIRTFSRRVLLGAGTAALGAAAFGVDTAARFKLHADKPLNKVPLDYSGFSIETVQLADPAVYHAKNAGLVALYRRLSPHGVLRVGGNSSEFCWWKARPDAPPPPVKVLGHGRADNWMPQRFYPITPEAVENLRGFLDACGWSCIWGLNFGTGSPEGDAEEAAFVARALGPRLKYFQIGNEPDFYREPNNLLRPAGWDFPDYLNEWTSIAEAVAAKVPEARFGGPDVGAASDWIVRFAHDAKARLGKRLVALSGHYYASGPPDAPSVTIENLLKPNDAAAKRMAQILPAARAAGLAFRMTEGNSCYRGGKPGMSNAFASSLWGANYMLDMAVHGCKGINFHSGGREIAISLGDKLPGAKSTEDRKAASLGAFYSPFAGNPAVGYDARPLFYGMMLAERFAGATMVACDFHSGGVNATAYAAVAKDGVLIALINKDAGRRLKLAIGLGEVKAKGATLQRLTAPSLDATAGVQFAGDAVAHQTALWSPQDAEWITPENGTMRVVVPAASAALLTTQA
jgi:hypothetical protein